MDTRIAVSVVDSWLVPLFHQPNKRAIAFRGVLGLGLGRPVEVATTATLSLGPGGTVTMILLEELSLIEL